MRILIPTGIFHPEAGGPATYLYHLLPELQAQGHSVEVITFGDGGHDYPYPVTRIPRRHLLQRNWAYFQAVRARLPHADLVFRNSLGLPLPPIPVPQVLKVVGDLAWERAINRGWLPPDTDIDQFQGQRFLPHIEWLKWLRAREARRMDQIIVPSDYLRRMVIGWAVDPARVQVIYNAFEAQAHSGPTLRRSSLGLPPEGPLLLTVARLTAWKGVDALLQALAELPEVHLAVVGEGPALPDLKRLAEALALTARVHFLGRLPQERLRHYYHAADYLVLYSGYEGLSHVILEALSAGTPVIASDKGGNPELVRHGENGFLVPYRDVVALRQQLREALARPRNTWALHFDGERFHHQRMVQESLALLERVAAQ